MFHSVAFSVLLHHWITEIFDYLVVEQNFTDIPRNNYYIVFCFLLKISVMPDSARREDQISFRLKSSYMD